IKYGYYNKKIALSFGFIQKKSNRLFVVFFEKQAACPPFLHSCIKLILKNYCEGTGDAKSRFFNNVRRG
ncbi:hypothetical protein, partial [Cloacibacillus porcorum]